MAASNRERELARKKAARRMSAWEAAQARKKNRQRIVAGVVAGVMVLGLGAGVIAMIAAGNGEPGEPAATQPPADTPAPEQTDPPAAPPVTATDPAALPQFAMPDVALAEGRTWTGTIRTNRGEIGLELYGDLAPAAVASFIFLAREGFWADSACHRLTTAGIFVLQCGDPSATGMGGPGYNFGPVENAPADNMYPAGTLAMARRGGDGMSMGSQFFLVYEDSTIGSDAAGGYTVFGRITSGLDIVQAVAGAGVWDGSPDGQPALPVIIEGVDVQ